MSLLLTFFVLLLSFSSMEEVRFNHAMGSLHGALGVFESEPEMSQPIRVTMPLVRGSIRQSQNIRKAAEGLEKTLSEEGMEGDVTLEGSSAGLVIRMKAPVLYGLGDAEIVEGIHPVLGKIADILRLLPNEIVVQGHTDNTPISSDEYPSNWELSYQRAVNVLRYFILECDIYPRRMSAEGYGQYRPLDTNATEEGRSKNRRVEVHLLYAGENDGNLEVITDAFRDAGMEGSRQDGSPIEKRGRGRRRR